MRNRFPPVSAVSDTNVDQKMADTSSSLSLPFIQPSQAQKHVTHNEALRVLDALTQLAVTSDEINTPPSNPSEGARYIVGTGGSGAWSGRDGEIALFETGSWRFFVPRAGWRAFVINRETLIAYDGAEWIDLDSDELQEIVQFGLGMTAQSGTPFSAKLNASLWTALYEADGGTGDLISTINKENLTDDAGIVFQTDFGTRAILGLFGNDNLKLAVSPDNSTFFDGLNVDNATGIVEQPNLPRFKATTNFDNFCTADTWTRISINESAFNDQNTFDAGTNQFTAPASGTYVFGATLVFKENTSASVTTAGQFVKNGLNVVSGSRVANTGPHQSEETTVVLQCMDLLAQGDTVEVEGRINSADGYFMADRTVFWGHKVG